MASSCSIVSMAVTTNAAPCVETGYHAVDDPAGSFILYMRIQGTARPTVCRRSQRLVGQREPHQHESGCHLRTAYYNTRRRFHLVPFIGLEGSAPPAFADMAGDAAERGRKGGRIGSEMAQCEKRERGVER